MTISKEDQLDKAHHPLDDLKNEEKFFRFFQKKYLFKNPEISILAGRLADESKQNKEFDEYFKRTYGTNRPGADIRESRFCLGET